MSSKGECEHGVFLSIARCPTCDESRITEQAVSECENKENGFPVCPRITELEAELDNSKANHRLLIETTRGSCACRVDEDENVVGECGYHQHLRAERNKALDANAVLLSENCKLILERDKLNGYLQEIFDGVNIPILMGSTNGSDGR
jgi:hypothetical protein